jgi:hypothetical protein
VSTAVSCGSCLSVFNYFASFEPVYLWKWRLKHFLLLSRHDLFIFIYLFCISPISFKCFNLGYDCVDVCMNYPLQTVSNAWYTVFRKRY